MGGEKKTRSYEETVCIVIMNHQWEISRIQQMEVLYHIFGHIVVHNMEIHLVINVGCRLVQGGPPHFGYTIVWKLQGANGNHRIQWKS